MKEIKEQLKPYTILYAEDNKDVQKTIVDYLQRYFDTIYVANDGKEALSLYKKMKPDILFLDINMPYIDGLSVAKEVRQQDEKIPIVMLTAYTDTEKLLCATELNLCKYLVKPIDPLQFKDTLYKLSKILNKEKSLIYIKEEYSWNEVRQELKQHTRNISLTQKEQALLSLLLSHKNQCFSYEDIQVHVWKDTLTKDISIQSVKLQVTLLRKKLPKNCIKNVYGKGYIFYI